MSRAAYSRRICCICDEEVSSAGAAWAAHQMRHARDSTDSPHFCKHCRKPIERRRFPSGFWDSPAAVKRRQFCNRACKTLFVTGKRPNGGFKPGHKLGFAWPIGTVIIKKDIKGKLRRFIKTEESPDRNKRWVLYSRWLWAKHHGPIPKGCDVHHKDRDTLNDTLSNYAAVTKSQHAKIHERERLEARVRRYDRTGRKRKPKRVAIVPSEK